MLGIEVKASTVYRVLKKEGLLLPARRKRKSEDQGHEPPKP